MSSSLGALRVRVTGARSAARMDEEDYGEGGDGDDDNEDDSFDDKMKLEVSGCQAGRWVGGLVSCS